MIIRSAKPWLAIVAFILLTPIFSLAHPRDRSKGCDWFNERDCRHVAVAEGGSAASYLFAVGATCLGAIFARARLTESRLS
jgi:hypothetical protein